MQVDFDPRPVQPKQFVINVDYPTVIGRKRNIKRNNIEMETQYSKMPILFEIKAIGIDPGLEKIKLVSTHIIHINIRSLHIIKRVGYINMIVVLIDPKAVEVFSGSADHMVRRQLSISNTHTVNTRIQIE